jgi:hypothetical protein
MKTTTVRFARTLLLSAIFFIPFTSSTAQADLEHGAPSQRPGRITGRIIDSKTGAGITEATVIVDGSALAARSVIDGRFTLSQVPSGKVDLIIRRLGYAVKRVTGINVEPGDVVAQNISLDAATVDLGTTVVSASAERGTVNEALDLQRTATGIVNSVTAEQIARNGDGDAAQAMNRVSGITLQNGRYVFVRGLGERYTTASLDGARIPSPEPEKKVVPLDLFPSGLLDVVTTTKTFTPDQPGDFSGGQVDVKTREFPAHGIRSVSMGFGGNAIATGKRVATAPTAGAEWLGFGGGDRSLPSSVAAAGDFGALNARQIDAVARSFRNVWTPLSEPGDPNVSTSVALGGKTSLGLNSLGYLASGSYSRAQEIKSGEVRATAVPDGSGSARPYNEFRGSTSSGSVLWGGLLNFNALLGQKTLVTLNNNYNRSADNEAHQDHGTLDDYGFETVRSSLAYIERSVRSNQLRIERSMSGSQQLSLSFTSSAVTRKEPDRSELQYVREPDPRTGTPLPYALFSYNPDGARRTFSDLSETALSSSIDYRAAFGDPARAVVVKVGSSFRKTDRDADNSSFSLLGYTLTRSQREQTAEKIFGAPTGTSSPLLSVLLNSTGGSYTASERNGAGNGMLDVPIGTRLHIIGGARVERALLDVASVATTGERSKTRLDNTDLLPSLVANISLTDAQNVRVSASHTVSRPEYRELSPVTYRDVIEQRDIFGNPELRRATIRNFDARWEWFPRAGEILGFGAFAKKFTDPIERVDVATSGASRLGFINADGASIYGLEAEARKSISSLAVFGNATVMKSSIDITSDRLSSLTNRKRSMVGQAPYVANAGVTWSSSSAKTSATLLYNVVGHRITAAGSTPLPDTYESARSGVDMSLQAPLFGALSARLDAKNLLDSPFEVTQGAVVRERYRSGRVISIGLKWQQ